MYSVMLAAMLAAGAQAPTFGHHSTVQYYSPYVQTAYVYTYNGGCCGASYYGCYGMPTYYWAPNYCVPTAVWGCYGGCFGTVPYYGSYSGGIAVSAVAANTSPRQPESTLVPRTEAEREAVRKALEDVRKVSTPDAATSPRSTDSPPVPPVKSTPPLTTIPSTPPTQPETPGIVPPRMTIPSPPPFPQSSARITVEVPEDARLWVDSVYCPLPASVRSFNTPALQPGVDYFYTLRIEVEREGHIVNDSRRVLVSAGREVNVTFVVPEAVVARR